jgi:transposase
MRFSVGLDNHKRFIRAVIKQWQNGKVVTEATLVQSELKQFLDWLPRAETRVVLESSTCVFPIYDWLLEHEFNVVVAHPARVKAIASARIKTDKIDARTLADLLRAELIPAAYIPNKETRAVRELVRYRVSLVEQHTKITNQIYALLTRHGVEHHTGTILTRRARTAHLAILTDETARFELTNLHQQHDQLRTRIKDVQQRLETIAATNPDAQLLKTIPRVGAYTALTVLAELGDYKRFPTGKHAASYAGFVPSTYQSGNTTRHGSITKRGSAYIRRALGQAALRLIANHDPLREYYDRRKPRLGAQKAITATAHRLFLIMYQMLTDQRPYRTQAIA